MSSTATTDVEITEAERPSRLAAGQDPAKRQQILEGANRVFSQMGFDAASMNDITREAGVSKGTIYVYFDSKEELFLELCNHYREILFADIYHALESDGDLREALIEFGSSVGRCHHVRRGRSRTACGYRRCRAHALDEPRFLRAGTEAGTGSHARAH